MIVVSHDAFNQAPGWNSVIVVPMSTSASQGRRGPTVAELPAGSAGLPRAGFALCHQVTTLDRAKLTRKVGVLPPGILREVEEAIKTAMGMN